MQDNVTSKKKINWLKVGAVAVILLLVAGIFVYKSINKVPDTPTEAIEEEGLPKLVNLMSETCVPCRLMVPILEEIKKEYKGRIVIQVIDIYKQEKEAAKYNIWAVPTQILYDKDGKEVGRHEGFISKEDLIEAFEQVGVK